MLQSNTFVRPYWQAPVHYRWKRTARFKRFFIDGNSGLRCEATFREDNWTASTEMPTTLDRTSFIPISLVPYFRSVELEKIHEFLQALGYRY